MNRRKFIVVSAQVSTAALFGFASLNSCSQNDPCDDLSNLTVDEINERKSYNYLKETPDRSKTCKNCEFWIEPEEDQLCGNCALFEGPVHATGYCDGWSPLES